MRIDCKLRGFAIFGTGYQSGYDYEPARVAVENDGGEIDGADRIEGGRAQWEVPLRDGIWGGVGASG